MTPENLLILLLTAVAVGTAVYFLSRSPALGDAKKDALLRDLRQRLQDDEAFAQKAAQLLEPPPPPQPEKPSGEPVRLLSLFQREGRLLDFLLEDIQAFSNDQIGSAVRDIHQNCRKVLQEHLVMEAILKEDEGSQVDIPSGFDPSAIQLVGNVTGQPPFRGILRHHGWKVSKIKLQHLPVGQNPFILQPAEVELP